MRLFRFSLPVLAAVGAWIDWERPDGTPVPAAHYGLSHQRRFVALAHNRFKTTGIYRIRLYSYPAHED